MGDALANAGLGAASSRAYSEAATRAKGAASLDLRRLAAEQILNAGKFDEGDLALRAVLVAVGLGLPVTPLSALIGLRFFRLRLWLRGLGYRERRAQDIPPTGCVREASPSLRDSRGCSPPVFRSPSARSLDESARARCSIRQRYS